jgi:transposase
MGAPISIAMRDAILRARERGLSYEETAPLLGVGFATVNRVLRLQRETGSVEPRPRGGGNLSPITGDEQVGTLLRALVAAMPDATAAELAEALKRGVIDVNYNFRSHCIAPIVTQRGSLPHEICYRAGREMEATMAKIGVDARRELVSVLAERYRAGGRTEKRAILDEFAAVTGYHRKHAILILNSTASRLVRSVQPRLCVRRRGSLCARRVVGGVRPCLWQAAPAAAAVARLRTRAAWPSATRRRSRPSRTAPLRKFSSGFV